MENQDLSREAQIWQRVMAAPRMGQAQIRPLLLTAWEAVSVYRHLTAVLSGKNRDRARYLQSRAMDTVEALKGLQLLSGEQPGKLLPVPVPREPVRRLVEKSWFRAGSLMAEFSAREPDGEFGAVYRQLAAGEGENRLLLARLLGGLEG